MGSALDSLVNTIPIVITGGIAMRLTEGMFGKTQDIGSAWQGSSQWQSISKAEAYDLISKRKVSMLQKNPGKIYTWGYDKFKFENGKFWLA